MLATVQQEHSRRDRRLGLGRGAGPASFPNQPQSRSWPGTPRGAWFPGKESLYWVLGETWLPGLPTAHPWSLSPDLGQPPPALSFLFPSQGQRRSQEPLPGPAAPWRSEGPSPATHSVSLSPTPSRAVPTRGVRPPFLHRALLGSWQRRTPAGWSEHLSVTCLPPRHMGHSSSASPCTPPSTLPLPGLQAASCPAVGSSHSPGRPSQAPARPSLSSPSEAGLGSLAGQPYAWLCFRLVLPGFAFPENSPESQSQVVCGGRAYRRLRRHSHRFKKHHGEFLLRIQHDTQPGR